MNKFIEMNKKRLMLFWTACIGLLAIPLIAMQFTDEVNWTIVDFVIAGGLLFSLGFLVDLLLDKVKPKTKSWAIIALVLILFLLLWAELAVGIFGSPIAGN